ncbi:MAG: CDP-glucose 4,6-dehydratase, partial [Clostridia bacterium]|nr:CDP-glucose 4,6-dehydratase [Clostridia bacterium]
IKSLLNNEAILIRNPNAIRPWQHVLEPLSGYIMLAEHLYKDGTDFAEAWNFGPDDADAKTVEWVVRTMCQKWGGSADFEIVEGNHPHEAQYLKLDCSKARLRLNWHPKWNVEQSIDKVIEWTHAYRQGKPVREVCLKQIDSHNS